MAFGNVFINLFLNPAVYDAAKLGTGCIWKKVQEAYRREELDSPDIQLYYLIEEICDEEAGRGASSDDKAAACEIICNTLISCGEFREKELTDAVRRLKGSSSVQDVAGLKKKLDNRLNENQGHALAALRTSVEELKKELRKLSEKEEQRSFSASVPVQRGKDFSLEPLSAFAHDCLAETVFVFEKKEKGTNIGITFEPVRIRPSIPDFAGIYYRCSPPLDISRPEYLHIAIDFKDTRLRRLALELKKEGHSRPEDEYKFTLANENHGLQEYDLPLDGCPAAIRKCLGEMVLAVYNFDFADMNNLTAEIEIQAWYFH